MLDKPHLSMRALVSEKHKLVFLWTPKAGCTTTKNIFYNHIGVELPENRVLVNESIWHKQYGHQRFKLPDNHIEYLIIQFCRNPYERAISSFLSHVDHFYQPSRCDHLYNTLHDFLLALQTKSIRCDDCLYHSCPQFMTECTTDIIKIENLDQEIDRVNKKYTLNLKNLSFENQSKRKKIDKNQFPKEFNKTYEQYLREPGIIKIINEIYEKDIEFFKYTSPQ